MQLVYSLKNELTSDPGQLAAVQALTLDLSRPFGLKGTFGLFGSDEWWQSIKTGRLQKTELSGVITLIGRAGMHNESPVFNARLDNGDHYTYDTVADIKKGIKQYIVGKRVKIVLVREPLKNPSASRGTHSDIVLEIWIEE